MALMAPVEDGKLVESTSQNSLKKTTGSSNNGMDKDAFLQILVAQMKYQDPLEPTSNTEYISQYAQFSQVEQMSNMATNMDLQRAGSLVGEEVYVRTTDSKGDTKYMKGKVDYVIYENNKAYVSIEENLYPLEDVVQVTDADYEKAYAKAEDFVKSLKKLPNISGVELTEEKDIDALEKEYNEMTEYEKTFLASDVVKELNKYTEKLKELRQADVSAFENRLSKLPAVDEMDLTIGDEIDQLEEKYKGMSDKEKELLSEGTMDNLNRYIEKLKELRQDKGEDTKENGDNTEA